jgi:hypothetical protein
MNSKNLNTASVDVPPMDAAMPPDFQTATFGLG